MQGQTVRIVLQAIRYIEEHLHEKTVRICFCFIAGISIFVFLFSLLGGEPFEPENQGVLTGLLRRIKETYPQKDVWCYSGYLYDVDLAKGGKVHTDVTEEMLSYIDVLVDGEFVEELKDVTLVFRGSSNQRLIELKKNEG